MVERKVLYCTAKKTTHPPKTAPIAYDAVIMIAMFAGFYIPKARLFTGVKSIWQGMTKLSTLTAAIPFIQGVWGKGNSRSSTRVTLTSARA
ncbi:MAG: hypothetical protein LBK46_02255 [Oscillospiraceae bacterium]|nr:hypothetical protein [Oscillospiraceae bacterium]